MNEVFQIGWSGLGISLFMMLGVVLIDQVMKLMLGKEIVIGAFRVFIQLYIVGYILKWIFGVNNPWVVVVALVVMSIFAGYNAVKRTGDISTKGAVIAIGVIVFATFISAGFGCVFVIGIKPWFNPQYIIPIGGMVMNGAMNGVALGISNLNSKVKDNGQRIICALSMGATGSQAIHPLLTEAARRALIPTINSMMTAGIVQLPGMMTGQIIAGLEPTSAVQYQIIIFYMITTAVIIAVLLSMMISARSYFTKDHQLKQEV